MATVTPIMRVPSESADARLDRMRVREIARECHLLQLALTALDSGGAGGAGSCAHDIPACPYQLSRIEWLVSALLPAETKEDAG